MSEDLLHDFGIDAKEAEKRSGAVPRVVRADPRQTGPLEERHEGTPKQVLGLEWGTLRGSEDEIGLRHEGGR